MEEMFNFSFDTTTLSPAVCFVGGIIHHGMAYYDLNWRHGVQKPHGHNIIQCTVSSHHYSVNENISRLVKFLLKSYFIYMYSYEMFNRFVWR